MQSIRNKAKIPTFESPILMFINPISGGGIGRKMLDIIRKVEEKKKVENLHVVCLPDDVEDFLEQNYEIIAHPKLRCIACGGDGTVNWVMQILSSLYTEEFQPPLAVLPLGTGNDMSRSLGWGPGVTSFSIKKIFDTIKMVETSTSIIDIDTWDVSLTPNKRVIMNNINMLASTSSNENATGLENISNSSNTNNSGNTSHANDGTNTNCPSNDNANRDGEILNEDGEINNNINDDNNTNENVKFRMTNYFSLGVDAAVAYDYETLRTDKKPSTRLGSFALYVPAGAHFLGNSTTIEDFSHITLTGENDSNPNAETVFKANPDDQTITFLSIKTMYAGKVIWRGKQKAEMTDGKVEILLNKGAWRLAMTNIGFAQPRPYGQARAVRVETSQPCYYQIDGEAKKVNQPTIFKLEHHGTYPFILPVSK